VSESYIKIMRDGPSEEATQEFYPKPTEFSREVRESKNSKKLLGWITLPEFSMSSGPNWKKYYWEFTTAGGESDVFALGCIIVDGKDWYTVEAREDQLPFLRRYYAFTEYVAV
jgi:hypothetical protein